MNHRATAQLQFNIDQDNIKTQQVKQLISDFIKQITSITETYPLENGVNPETLVIAVERAINTFLLTGDQAIRECNTSNQEAVTTLKNALLDVEDCGKEMIRVGRTFIRDSSSNQKRSEAVAAGRGLLEAVAQLLIIADMMDIALMVDSIQDALHLLKQLRNSSSNNEVIQRYDQMMAHIEEIEQTVRKRICQLLDPDVQNDMIAATSTLRMACPLVKQSTAAFVRHPECDESRLNRDYAHGMVHDSLVSLQNLLRGHPSHIAFSELGRLDNLATKLDEFQGKVFLEPKTYRQNKHRPDFERLVEEIASGSGRLCDSDTTRPDRKNAIITGCNSLRQALQDLLSEYERNCGRADNSDDLNVAMIQVAKKTKDLRRHLRRCVVDHISDAFLDIYTPLLALVEERDPERVREFAHTFLLHADKMCEVALLACEMSTDVEGVRNIRLLATQLRKLAPEVVHAAILLSTHPESEVARQNMEHYKTLWSEKVQLLTAAIDSIISLDDFLAVSEDHIKEDALRGNEAVNRGDCDLLDQSAGAIRGRGLRVCGVVDDEMEFAPLNPYTDRVRQATRILQEKSVPQFTASAEQILKNVETSILDGTRSVETIRQDSDDYIGACMQILEDVKQIRNALLLNRSPDDYDSDNDYEEEGQTVHETNSKVSESDNQQKIMRQLPAEDKLKIQKAIDVFKITQTKFECEVARWDDSGNDIIVLAKHMSMLMNNMADFTRGRGPYKTTMDVIKAAQEISVAGAKLKALANQIAEESADSMTKTDLYSHLDKIPTFCQQLNICSKVKADVQEIEGGITGGAVESATSLVQTARNLLSTVVATVKCAYIASTKFRRPNSSGPRVEWKMAPPLKQPLVRPQKTTGVIRRASERRPLRPTQALAEFTH